MRIDCYPYRLPFAQPIRGATHRTGWWLRLTAEDGLVGWGEAACWPGFGSDEATVEAALHGEGTAPEVACALDVALLDLAAWRNERSIARMLHPNAVKRVPTHVLVNSVAQAQAAERAGVTALKVKVDQGDLARVQAIRNATTLPMRLDCNACFGPNIGELRALTPEWIEQPTAPGEPLPAGPIAVDEAIVDAASVHAALAQGAQVIVLKPMFLGGLRATQALARIVWAAGAQVCVTHALGSAIDRIAARHLAAALLAENPNTACGLAGQLRDDVAPLPPLRGGYLDVPQGPGLGIEVQI